MRGWVTYKEQKFIQFPVLEAGMYKIVAAASVVFWRGPPCYQTVEEATP